MDRPEQHFKAEEEFRNVPEYLAERKKRLDKLALEKRKREEEEEKNIQKVMILLLLCYSFVTPLLLLFLFITYYNIL